MRKVCPSCKIEQPRTSFWIDKTQPDGRHPICEPCWKMEKRQEQKALSTIRRREGQKPKVDRKMEKIKKMALAIIENPKVTNEELAQISGYKTTAMVTLHLRGNEYLKALVAIARSEMTSFVPLALRGVRDSLESTDKDVKLRSALEILKNEGLMGPTKIDVNINDMRNKTTEELMRLVANAKEIPTQIISAEVLPS